MNLNNKTILVTGGTGTFGQYFIEYILSKFSPKKIIIYSRDEQKQFLMQKKLQNFKRTLRFFLGDIRDIDRLRYAMHDVDVILHTAAIKHVPFAEYNPTEAIKTNIIGAQNLIELCLSPNSKVKRVIALSTDKASSPINLYGATKLASDKLFVAANNYRGKKGISFSVVRYGNVMGSKGSIIPFLISNKKNYIELTDKNMTRFNITLKQSLEFVLNCFKIMQGGEIFIPKLKSVRITDIIKAISPNKKIKIIGLRPGEKVHEEMISKDDMRNVVEHKNFYIITMRSEFVDSNIKNYLKKNKNAKRPKKIFSYNSYDNKDYMSLSEIKKIINQNYKSFVY